VSDFPSLYTISHDVSHLDTVAQVPLAPYLEAMKWISSPCSRCHCPTKSYHWI
jgi:hypothetical protein